MKYFILAIFMFVSLTMVSMAEPAQMCWTVPDAVAPEVVKAFASVYDYQTEIEDAQRKMIPNPETKAQFMKRLIRQHIKEVYKAYKVKDLETQRTSILEQAEQDVSGVE